MSMILFPTHCPICNQELVHRLKMQSGPIFKPGVQMFHKADNTPICQNAVLEIQGEN